MFSPQTLRALAGHGASSDEMPVRVYSTTDAEGDERVWVWCAGAGVGVNLSTQTVFIPRPRTTDSVVQNTVLGGKWTTHATLQLQMNKMDDVSHIDVPYVAELQGALQGEGVTIPMLVCKARVMSNKDVELRIGATHVPQEGQNVKPQDTVRALVQSDAWSTQASHALHTTLRPQLLRRFNVVPGSTVSLRVTSAVARAVNDCTLQMARACGAGALGVKYEMEHTLPVVDADAPWLTALRHRG